MVVREKALDVKLIDLEDKLAALKRDKTRYSASEYKKAKNEIIKRIKTIRSKKRKALVRGYTDTPRVIHKTKPEKSASSARSPFLWIIIAVLILIALIVFLM